MVSAKDPKLHLIVDGVPLAPRSVIDQIYTFRLRPGARRVTIASRSVVPVNVGGADPRSLGVPLHRLVLKGSGAPIEIGPDHSGLTHGFHANEGTHRWTNGRAVLPPELLARFAGEVTIEVHIGKIELEYPAEPS
jgi:hypothetical protein